MADPSGIDGATVLITPPARTFDVQGGYTATWQLIVITDGPGNANAWQELDHLTDQVAALLPIERTDSVQAYDRPAIICYFSEVLSS